MVGPSMTLPKPCSPPLAPILRARQFHCSSVARRNVRSSGPTWKRVGGIEVSEDIIATHAEGIDSSVAGHLRLQQERQHLYYMRLIEHEIPKLVAYRRPFVPPTPATPLIVRSVSFGGEEHPAELKRTIVVPIAHLPLKDAAAIHKFKLLAGPRWSPEPPRDSGVGKNEDAKEHGYFKISCEDFPKAAMNLKWASDALDRLLAEANKGADKFEDVPLDTRHIDSKVRKGKKGDHVYVRGGKRPSIRDFPKEWLPVQGNVPPPAAATGSSASPP